MPVTKSAEKKLRTDRRRRIINLRVRRKYATALKTARNKPTPANINKAYQELDMAAKKHVIHQNKAGRLKSRLVKNLHQAKSR